MDWDHDEQEPDQYEYSSRYYSSDRLRSGVSRLQNKKRENLKIKTCVDIILKELKELGAYIYHESTYGSVYIKFKKANIGSLRIADHNGRTKYRYRWSLRLDYTEKYTIEGDFKQHIYPTIMIEDLIKHIKSFDNFMKRL